MTRYVFLGAGAVGSALGGLLAHHGSDVLLIARGEHGRAMAEAGVRLRCPDTTLTVAAPTATASDEVRLGVDDVLVLTTKTQQAEAAIGEWADVPVHDEGGGVAGRVADLLPVLTASNGVAVEEIALRYVERVYAVCVWFPTVLIDPGEVIVRGAPLRGVFHVGRYGSTADAGGDARLLDAVSRDWGAAGCPVRLPEAVMAWKYRKLLANLGNVLQALLGSDAAAADDVQQAADREARDVLSVAGVSVVDDDTARAGWSPEGLEFRAVPGEPAELGGSSWQSLVRGAGSIETDFLNGEIALIGRRVGRPAPVNARLAALARRAARAGARPGSIGLDEVRAVLRPEG